jgi:hypothetical protein
MKMIVLKTYEYGLDCICEDAEKILTKVMGTDHSKKEKDVAISKAVGLIKALRLAYEVVEIKEDPEPEVSENE